MQVHGWNWVWEDELAIVGVRKGGEVRVWVEELAVAGEVEVRMPQEGGISVWIWRGTKGRRQKSGSFGWCPPQNTYQPPTSFFFGNLFLLRIPWHGKLLIRFESGIFTLPLPEPQLGQIQTLMKWHFCGCISPNHWVSFSTWNKVLINLNQT